MWGMQAKTESNQPTQRIQSFAVRTYTYLMLLAILYLYRACLSSCLPAILLGTTADARF
jgi:hypothetical protein